VLGRGHTRPKPRLWPAITFDLRPLIELARKWRFTTGFPIRVERNLILVNGFDVYHDAYFPLRPGSSSLWSRGFFVVARQHEQDHVADLKNVLVEVPPCTTGGKVLASGGYKGRRLAYGFLCSTLRRVSGSAGRQATPGPRCIVRA
jgi:hypothetical protein